ncbi:DUF6881 domain-containing protein [Agrobacterium vitis]|uniref:DUF6881 domain-containing protein n=1 Tax=Agrobacterium vitis TaxID=373 RepID=UPI0012E84A73|nr:hypothetical protein [Agrobacterium vitis]MUZ66386.1 hypothetical protein [Agrobacterium vitis]
MIYMHVKCDFDHEDQPIEIYSEMDDDRNEIRKVHFFSNGECEIASKYFETVYTGLSSEPLPSVEEINADGQFFARLISSHEFEIQWEKEFKKNIYFRFDFDGNREGSR